MGNQFLRVLNTCTLLVAGPDTWIEGQAIQQLETTAKLKGMHAVAGMPDLHPGRGYPVGAAFFSTGYIYPALVGNDIGCGMSLWQTDIKHNTFKYDKAEKLIASIDQPLADGERSRLLVQDMTQSSYDYPFNVCGTIGGGNHFAELQLIDIVYDHTLCGLAGLNTKQLQLLVHSGSRGLGEKVLRHHISQHGHQGLVCGSPEFEQYVQAHDKALLYAQANRKLIALRLLSRLKAKGQSVLDIFHNTVTPATIQNTCGWLHRKGAAPADQGLVVIPGSRGDYSYIVQPLVNEASQQALFSLAHGAGRKWIRSECKGRLKHFSVAQLKRSTLGSRLICCNSDLVYEEAPQAYKSIESVIHALEGAGLVQKVARLRPMLTYKTQKEK